MRAFSMVEPGPHSEGTGSFLNKVGTCQSLRSMCLLHEHSHSSLREQKKVVQPFGISHARCFDVFWFLFDLRFAFDVTWRY